MLHLKGRETELVIKLRETIESQRKQIDHLENGFRDQRHQIEIFNKEIKDLKLQILSMLDLRTLIPIISPILKLPGVSQGIKDKVLTLLERNIDYLFQ